jgi:glucose-6-phosphate isomerase
MTPPLAILRDPVTGVIVDLTMAKVPTSIAFGPALAAMTALEAGAMANSDEGRRVGHYWLRDPTLAPSEDIAEAITASWRAIAEIDAASFHTVLLIGIGGSALGPALAIDALSQEEARRFLLLDTVDPQAIAEMLTKLTHRHTLVIVASKSGATLETMTATNIVEAWYSAAGLDFGDHAIAITEPGSPLAARAATWRAQLPIWDWVGGRTSITSPVGLTPMHLCGIDIDAFLQGAREMDAWTRAPYAENPAAQLAALWAAEDHHTATILPYCDRLQSLGRYLQQLVMESLGKSKDRGGITRHFGLAVLGNKGSADQHALMQQLRSGPFGVVNHFIHVGQPPETDPLTCGAGDLQFSLMAGSRQALHEVGRPVVTIRLPVLDARRMGALVALFERTVGLTAELLDLNAYNQPGVEAGKREARFQLGVLEDLHQHLSAYPAPAGELARSLGLDVGIVWHLCHHLGSTGRAVVTEGKPTSEDRFQAVNNEAK